MNDSDFTLAWTSNVGGVLLLIPVKHLPAWEGIEPPSNDRVVQAEFRFDPTIPATDYDRACDIEGYVGFLEVGAGQALVLGDEPLMTAWLPKAVGGILVRWRYSQNEADLLTAVEGIGFEAFTDTGVRFEVDDAKMILLSACDSVPEFSYDFIEFPIVPGRYRVFSADFEQGTTAGLLHWLYPAT